MSIDIGNLLSDMAGAAGGALEEGGEAVSQGMAQILANKKETLALLIDALEKGPKNGGISPEEFESEMARERLVLEAELIGLEIQGKAAIQKAMNAAMDVLKGAVAQVL